LYPWRLYASHPQNDLPRPQLHDLPLRASHGLLQKDDKPGHKDMYKISIAKGWFNHALQLLLLFIDVRNVN